MKKTVILAVPALCMALLGGCTQDAADDTGAPQNPGTPQVIAALQSTGDTVTAAYYAAGFDWEYDALPVLTLDGRRDVLDLEVGDAFGEAVSLGENHYTYTGDSGEILCETYELTADENGTVSLGIDYRGSDRDEEAVYFLRDEQGGQYVFKVVLPLAVESVDTEDELVQLFMQRAGRPVLDCVLADDGAYDLAGVVIYEDDELSPLCVAFVGFDGYYNRVGIHAGLTDDLPLTYLGNAVVEFSATGEDDAGPGRFAVEFFRDGDGVNFRIVEDEI